MIFTTVVALVLTSQVSAKAVSLKAMCADSETVFEGRVAKITHTSIAKIEVVEIEFAEVQWHKGKRNQDQTLVVKQANFTFSVAPLKPGDRVFWFLPPPSEVGLRAPIGSESGDFRIIPDPTKKSKLAAINRRNNTGLDDPEFKDGESIDLIALEVAVDKFLTKETPQAPSKSLPAVD